MLKVEFDFSGLERQLDSITEAASDAVRPAAQAGAQVFYDEVKSRAPRSEKAHSTKGKKQTYQPGNLQRAIYQAYADESVEGKEAVYAISWNKSKAFYGQFVEFGTRRMAPRSFVRSSYEAKKNEAVQAVEAELFKRLQAKL